MTTQAFNFRKTLAFVTDGTDEYAIYLGNEDYDLTTPNGIVCGYTTVNHNRTDRNSGVDRRLAGEHTVSGASASVFQVDWVAEEVDIRMACGSPNFAMHANHTIKDNTTTITTVTGETTGGEYYYDATGVERTSSSDWVSNNAAYNYTLTNGTIKLEFSDDGVSAGSAALNHFYIESAGGGGGASVPVFHNSYVNQGIM